jgi:hypothetical protein
MQRRISIRISHHIIYKDDCPYVSPIHISSILIYFLYKIPGFSDFVTSPLKLRRLLLLFLLFFRQLCKPKDFECYFPHLNFLRALRNAVAAMVPVDVLKGFVSAVANAAVDLFFH